MKLIIVAASAATLVACGAAREDFAPTERATAQTYEGYTAAEYQIDTSAGELGDAKVFSRGAFIGQVNGQERTLVHVGFEVENNSNQPLNLAAERLALAAALGKQVVQDVRPVRVEGPSVIQPGGGADIDVYFALPPGVEPQDADAFRVSWAIEGDGVTYAQRTPFMELEDLYYYTPSYDPFYADPYFYRPRIITYGFPYRHGWWY